MAFLCVDGSVMYMSADDISLEQKIPVGIYQAIGTKFGVQLDPVDFKMTHGKIYGDSQKRADHIVEAFKSTDEDRNLGVLLSGGRGLGKTLTTRLVIEQLYKDYPIITISEYTPGLPEFLTHVKGCVILMDEFEKFMSGNIHGNEAEDEQTKQETLLSIFDGNTGNQGNLFLLTVNNTYKLDENLLSRPGRIRYHYKYNSENADVVRAYCKDHLNDKSKTEDIVRTLGSTKYVSMDIIVAFVDELNRFPEETPESIKDYFNIDSSQSKLKYELTFKTKDGPLTFSCTWEGSEMPYDTWFRLKNSDYNKLLKQNGIKSGSDEEDDFDYPELVKATLEGTTPAYIFGSEKLDPSIASVSTIRYYDDGETDPEDLGWELLGITVTDPEFSSFSKKYDRNAF